MLVFFLFLNVRIELSEPNIKLNFVFVNGKSISPLLQISVRPDSVTAMPDENFVRILVDIIADGALLNDVIFEHPICSVVIKLVFCVLHKQMRRTYTVFSARILFTVLQMLYSVCAFYGYQFVNAAER